MLLLVLILSASQAASGSLRGRVLDAENAAPLAGVLVAVENGGAATHTDADGRFELVVPAGRQRLFVSLVGYALVRKEVDAATVGPDLTVRLAPGTGTYSESVTVAAAPFAPVEPAVPAQHVLGSAELQDLRGVLADDPIRAVQVLPGVVAGDDLRSEFTVRGSPFSHLNLTVDGFATPYILHTVRAIEDYSASGSVAMINSDILQEVVLFSGGYPQRFGNRTGAEIDFRLREGSRERTLGRLAVSGTNASTVIEGPLGRARRGSWLVSARQSYLDLIIRQIQEGIAFGFTDTQSKLVFDATPAQRIEFTFIGGRSSVREDDEDLDSDDRFVGRNRTALAIASWRYLAPRASVSTRLLGAFNDFTNINPGSVRLDEGFDKQLGVRTDANVPLRPSLSVDAGADAEWTGQWRTRQRSIGGVYRRINDFREDAVRAGGYIMSRLTAGPVLIVPGIRTDRWSLTGATTQSPWTQIEVSLPRSVALRAAAGVYHQFPAFEQVVGALAAATHRPQRAEQIDVALAQTLRSSVRWQVTVYNRQEANFFRRPGAEARLVGPRLVLGSRSAPFAQTLAGEARGVELLVQRRIAGGVSGWVSYSYGRHRYTDTTSGESFDADFDQRHTLNLYGFARLSDRTSVSAKLRVGSNTPAPGYFRESADRVLVSSSRNELRMPVYARLDARANRTFNWSRSRMTLFAEVMNVLNRDNVRFSPPSISRQTLEARNIFEQMIPIVPSVGVLFEF